MSSNATNTRRPRFQQVIRSNATGTVTQKVAPKMVPPDLRETGSVTTLPRKVNKESERSRQLKAFAKQQETERKSKEAARAELAEKNTPYDHGCYLGSKPDANKRQIHKWRVTVRKDVNKPGLPKNLITVFVSSSADRKGHFDLLSDPDVRPFVAGCIYIGRGAKPKFYHVRKAVQQFVSDPETPNSFEHKRALRHARAAEKARALRNAPKATLVEAVPAQN